MFTGLVECLGEVTALVPDPAGGVRVSIRPRVSLSGSPPQPGDSIAISGCCLTLIHATDDRGAFVWDFQAGRETLARTNLGQLRAGDLVNLERSLPVNGRLGGHFVQGHVDGLGQVAAIDRHGEWIDMTFSAPADLLRLMVPKGSVAVDGVSLTVVTVTSTTFSVALIPHTLEVTTLGQRNVGSTVNLETDILGKYVARLLDSRV